MLYLLIMSAVKVIWIVVILALLSPDSIYVAGGECGVVGRQQWGATVQKPLTNMSVPVELVVIQHTVGDGCTSADGCAQSVRNIQTSHVNRRRFDDIGYSFLVGGDGGVYEGRGWDHVGAHTLRYNDKSVGIAFIGNFDENLPSENALSAAQELLRCGVEKGHLSTDYRLVGHRQLSATKSPGDALYHEITKWKHWHDQ